MGRKAFFIRLQGCPVKCAWCDSASTWHPQYVPKQVRKATAAELADEAKASAPQFVVITGGEPCVHDLGPLVAALKSVGLTAHLETCGAYPIAPGIAWVTVSPKWAKPPLADALARADEVKLIVEAPDSISRWTDAVGGKWLSPNVWLHPEWSRRADPAVLRTITEQVKQGVPPIGQAGRSISPIRPIVWMPEPVRRRLWVATSPRVSEQVGSLRRTHVGAPLRHYLRMVTFFASLGG